MISQPYIGLGDPTPTVDGTIGGAMFNIQSFAKSWGIIQHETIAAQSVLKVTTTAAQAHISSPFVCKVENVAWEKFREDR